MTDNKPKEKKEIIEYTGNYGFINNDDKNSIFFSDDEDLGKDELIRYKIINIKIYTKAIKEKNYILGLDYTIRNFFNGKEIVISHKASEQFDDFKELKIKSGEYLKELNIRFSCECTSICQLGFTTSQNNKVLVGEEEGELKEIEMNEGNNVIIGMFGYIGEYITSIGCCYASKNVLTSSILYKFFLLRHLVKKDKNFKKKWDEKYDELPKEFKFIWNTVNLPDNIYRSIINCCI